MEPATDKQKFFLKTKGIDASKLTKEAASAVIKSLKEDSETLKADDSVKPGEFRPFMKSKQDQSSFYVAYARDIYLGIVEKQEKFTLEQSGKLMEHAIYLVKKARDELK